MTRAVLYSFRRCPYAMRARLAIAASGLTVELREVALRDKPDEMLEISPKGTVPVLQLRDGQVLEESLDIMHFALRYRDPAGWVAERHRINSEEMIRLNDGPFKSHLDRYKYPSRYEDGSCNRARPRDAAFGVIEAYESRLARNAWLLDDRPGITDMAILPFVRQFAQTDRTWFDAQPIPHVQNWLSRFLQSPLFISIMQKYPKWHPGDDVQVFPGAASSPPEIKRQR